MGRRTKGRTGKRSAKRAKDRKKIFAAEKVARIVSSAGTNTKHMAAIRRYLVRNLTYIGERTKDTTGRYAVFKVRAPTMAVGGNVRTLWHGTSIRNAVKILQGGFIPSRGGLLGAGVYFGLIRKASMYGGDNVIFKCDVALGRVLPARREITSWDADRTEGYDSVKGITGVTRTWGGSLRNPEWVIRDPARISIREVWLPVKMPKPRYL